MDRTNTVMPRPGNNYLYAGDREQERSSPRGRQGSDFAVAKFREELVTDYKLQSHSRRQGKPVAEPISRDREMGRIGFDGAEGAERGAMHPQVRLAFDLHLA